MWIKVTADGDEHFVNLSKVVLARRTTVERAGLLNVVASPAVRLYLDLPACGPDGAAPVLTASGEEANKVLRVLEVLAADDPLLAYMRLAGAGDMAAA